jgi:Asp-tRNA(Asn)/Glu-tRNA(Gln) amidotransferase A subunit family amidase
MVIARVQLKLSATMFATLAIAPALCIMACHKQEQAVVGAAETAVNAEHKAQLAAQAAAAKHDENRAQLAHIPLPTKSLYVDVHEPAAWANPFLSVDADSIDLRITMVDANTSSVGQGTLLRPAGARRQEIQVRPGDLTEALIALPDGAWRYGRVIAVAESPLASRKDQPKVRRNMEAVIQQLNDLGIVVEEWPAR